VVQTHAAQVGCSNVITNMSDDLQLTSFGLEDCGFPRKAGGTYAAGLSSKTNIHIFIN